MTISLVIVKCDDYYFYVLSLDYFELKKLIIIYPICSTITTTAKMLLDSLILNKDSIIASTTISRTHKILGFFPYFSFARTTA
jgi:hypothetical protein